MYKRCMHLLSIPHTEHEHTLLHVMHINMVKIWHHSRLYDLTGVNQGLIKYYRPTIALKIHALFCIRWINPSTYTTCRGRFPRFRSLFRPPSREEIARKRPFLPRTHPHRSTSPTSPRKSRRTPGNRLYEAMSDVTSRHTSERHPQRMTRPTYRAPADSIARVSAARSDCTRASEISRCTEPA